MNKKEWFFLIALIYVFLLLIYIISVLYKNNPDILQCSFNDLSTLLGIIISCMSIIITGYFVVMAVNAYGHIKDIEKIKKDANDTLITINKKFDGINQRAEIILKSIQLVQFRSIYINSDLLDEKTKNSFLLGIASLGDNSDIPHLKRLRGIENDKIQKIIDVTIERIEGRIQKESDSNNTILDSTITKDTKFQNFLKTIKEKLFRCIKRNKVT